MNLEPISSKAEMRQNKFTWIIDAKILPLTYYHSYFLAATCILELFTLAIFMGLHFLLLGCFWVDYDDINAL